MESIKNMNYLNKENHLEFYELLFNALADKVRLKIINEISNSINKSLCVCDLEEKLNLKQSKISYHLKKIMNTNIMNIDKNRTNNYNKIKKINNINNNIIKIICLCYLEKKLNLKQSKISYHLKKLVNANILNIEKHGTWNYYKINEKQIQVILTEDTCCKIL